MKKNKKLKKKAIALIKENKIKEALHILIDLDETIIEEKEKEEEIEISWEEYRDYIIENVPYSVFGM